MLEKKARFRLIQLLSLFLIPIIFYSCAPGLKVQKAEHRPEQFSKEINTFMKWDEKNSYPQDAILFVGSSSIRRWKTALAFPKLKVINRGFGGSHISDVNHFYEQIVKKYKPSKIVFYAGDNDIADGKSAAQVLKDYKIFIEKVEQNSPQTQVFFLPIKPSISRWKFWLKMSSANTMVKQFIKSKTNLFYVETTSAMLNDTLEPNADYLIDDGLHLNDQGYHIWNDILLPFIENK